MEAIHRESNGIKSRLALILCIAVFGICRVFSVGTACQVVKSIMKHQRGMLAGENLLWSKFSFLSFLMSRYRHEFGERQKEGQQWFGYKLHWSDQRKSVVLVAGPIGLEQKDPSSNKVGRPNE